jgi:hypothetical protein
MIMKTGTDGSVTLTYDGYDKLTIDNKVCTAYDYGSSATVSTLASTIEEITKKPEVRAEQRSSLAVSNRVVAKFYKDGFFTSSKDLIPAIKSIEVFNHNTVKMTFVNGDVQTSTVYEDDTFSLEGGLLRCIVKEMIGKEGTAVLGKLISYATDVYNKAEAEKKQKAKEEEKKRIATEKSRKKLQKHWEKKRVMEREKRIQEMAEAIVRAKEMGKNV